VRRRIVGSLIVREVIALDDVPFDAGGDWVAVASAAMDPDDYQPRQWLKVRGSWTLAAVYCHVLGLRQMQLNALIMGPDEWDLPIREVELT
jgi:hypothetical protein